MHRPACIYGYNRFTTHIRCVGLSHYNIFILKVYMAWELYLNVVVLTAATSDVVLVPQQHHGFIYVSFNVYSHLHSNLSGLRVPLKSRNIIIS